MKKSIFIVVLLLSSTLLCIASSRAQDDGYYECCCNLTCCYEYNLYTDPFTPREKCYTFPEECSISDILLKDFCEGSFTPIFFCIEKRLQAMEDIRAMNPDIFLMQYSQYTGSCTLSEIECLSSKLFGDNDPGLDILRQFRDEILCKNEKGKDLIDAYYEYGNQLSTIFEENPVLEDFARVLLEKTITRLYETLGSDTEFLTDELADDIDILSF